MTILPVLANQYCGVPSPQFAAGRRMNAAMLLAAKRRLSRWQLLTKNPATWSQTKVTFGYATRTCQPHRSRISDKSLFTACPSASAKDRGSSAGEREILPGVCCGRQPRDRGSIRILWYIAMRMAMGGIRAKLLTHVFCGNLLEARQRPRCMDGGVRVFPVDSDIAPGRLRPRR